MDKMKWFVIILIPTINLSWGALTHKQFADTLRLFRDTCVPKIGITQEQANDVKNDIFANVKEIKCYIMCVYQASGLTNKKGEVIESKFKTQIEVIMPPDIRERVRISFQTCKELMAKHKDSCEKSYALLKCFHDQNPTKYTFA